MTSILDRYIENINQSLGDNCPTVVVCDNPKRLVELLRSFNVRDEDINTHTKAYSVSLLNVNVVIINTFLFNNFVDVIYTVAYELRRIRQLKFFRSYENYQALAHSVSMTYAACYIYKEFGEFSKTRYTTPMISKVWGEVIGSHASI